MCFRNLSDPSRTRNEQKDTESIADMPLARPRAWVLEWPIRYLILVGGLLYLLISVSQQLTNLSKLCGENRHIGEKFKLCSQNFDNSFKGKCHQIYTLILYSV